MIWVLFVKHAYSEEWPTPSEQWPSPPPEIRWPSITQEWPEAPYKRPEWPTNTEIWPNNPTGKPGDDGKNRNLALIISLSILSGILLALIVCLFIFRKRFRCFKSKVKKSAATETLLQNKDPEL